MYKLVIFDADGTLTPLRGSVLGAFSFTLLPGVADRCAELRRDGVLMVVASNQSSGRDMRDLLRQAEWTRETLGIRHFDYQMNPEYQKPNPAMILGFMDWFSADPADVLFVGDRDTDRQAAEAAGIDFAWAADFFGGEP